MELITSPKTEYLLNASLETLHGESLEWIKEMDFWNEEMTFLYKLLHRSTSTVSFSPSDLAAIEKEMIQLTNVELSKVKGEVESHERSLAAVIESASMKGEEQYRQQHSVLLSAMHGLQRKVKAYKKNVFSLVKKYE